MFLPVYQFSHRSFDLVKGEIGWIFKRLQGLYKVNVFKFDVFNVRLTGILGAKFSCFVFW